MIFQAKIPKYNIWNGLPTNPSFKGYVIHAYILMYFTPYLFSQGEQIFPSVNSIYGIHNYSAFNPRIPIYSFDMKDVRTDNTW